MPKLGTQWYRRQLASDIAELKSQCEDYDKGKLDKALYMSGILRHLFQKNGLLFRLGATDVPLFNACGYAWLEDEPVYYEGFALIKGEGGPARFEPNLKDPSESFGWAGGRYIPAEKWWNSVVKVDGPFKYTRKSITLAISDKVVLHADESIPDDVYRLIEAGGSSLSKIMWIDQDHVKDHHLIALRVFAHEILHSPELAKLIP